MPFFTSVDEREAFLASLAHESIVPGCWFRHAVEAPRTLSKPDGSFKYYQDDEVLRDCAGIAVFEIAGITKIALGIDDLTKMVMFHKFFAALRSGGLEGFRAVLKAMGAKFDPAISQTVEMEVEPISAEAVQRWATLFAQNIVEISIQTARRPSREKIDAGKTAARGFGLELFDEVLIAIWSAMR